MKPIIARLAHVATHLLFAAICVMLWQVARRSPLDAPTLLAALAGGVLPDVDISTSFAGRLLLPLSRFLERRFGHRQEVHTAWPPLALGIASLLLPTTAWTVPMQAMAVGYLSHLVLDTLNPAGTAFLLPLSKMRVILLGGKVQSGQSSEIVLLVVLLLGTLALFPLTRFEPGELVQNLLPTLDTAREQYRLWESAYTVYAELEGTWNETHQHYAGLAEVLGFDPGGALKLRDVETGLEFTVGRHPIDDLYPTRIVLRKGEPLAQGETIPLAPTQSPLPTPTPFIVTILVEGVHDLDQEILVRPGDILTKGQLIAELFTLGSPSPGRPPAAAGPYTDTLAAALAVAEFELAKAEYAQALEGKAPSEATILQAEAAIAQIEASIASLQYLQMANPDLSYVPAQIVAAQARLLASEARLEEVKKWQGPTKADIEAAKARLAIAELRYRQAVATPTPAPSPTPLAPAAPQRVYSLVSGLVRHIRPSRIVGSVATIEIQVEIAP
ncbi:MAG: metal-dependent hydrolase [Thermoflexales bacterium]|nr:metal-dependent hydrolase [Thermoflexales bacterium]